MSGIARALAINPADPTMRYVAFDNGYIQALGAALPVEQDFWQDAVGSGKAPTWYGNAAGPLRAIQIIDWDAPSGYTLDQWGLVYPWGGVDPCPGGPGAPFTDGPDYFFGGNGGFQSLTYGFAWDFQMNPAGDGTGYFLTQDGNVHPFGTGIASITHSAFLTDTTAIRMVMDWSSKRYWVGDQKGRIHGKNGGNDRGVEKVGPGTVLPIGDGSLDAAGTWIYSRNCVGLVLYDVTANAKGWMADERGRVWAVGGADTATGFRPTLSSPIWADLAVVDDGTGSNPLRLAMVNRSGTMQEWVSSTAPTVDVGTPDDPTEDTTRPFVSWTYTDLQGDAQQSYAVKVFDSATFGGGGFDENTSDPVFEISGTGTLTRVQVDLDLVNDDYRAYVRATDTSELTSDWAFVEWTQDTTPPPIPTITTLVNGGLDGIDVTVNVDPMGLDPDAKIITQASDDEGETWFTISYDYTPDGSGDAVVNDRTAPFGLERFYRAQSYLYDATTEAWIGSGWSDGSASGTLTPQNIWALTVDTDGHYGVASADDWDVQPDITPSYSSNTSVFWSDSRPDPIVVDDGETHFATISAKLWALSNDARLTVTDLLASKQPMLLRSPLGDAWWVKSTGDESWPLVIAAPLATETTGIRDSHEVQLKFQAVARPSFGPTSGPLAGS